MAETYRYNSLSEDEIRLLQIEPGDKSEDIRIEISHVRLHALPYYEALSYTWGDLSKNKVPIACVQDGVEYKIHVTANCFAALRSLRAMRERTDCRFWIDAICIDQTNTPERNAQVALMGHIYRAAHLVDAYLGDKTEDSDLAIRSLDKLLPSAHDFRRSKGSFDPNELSALQSFFRRPWWRRVWILQEVRLARDSLLMCGDQYVQWKPINEFLKINAAEGYVEDFPGVLARHLADKFPIYMIPKKDLPNKALRNSGSFDRLFPLCRASQLCQASDPRDKIFALISMAKDITVTAQDKSLAADYGVTTAEAYVKYVAPFLKDFGLQVLTCVRGKSSTANLPSWVPDWSVSAGSYIFQLAEWGNTPPRFSVESYGSSLPRSLALKVRCFFLGSVEEVGRPLEINSPEWRSIIKEWVGMVQRRFDPRSGWEHEINRFYYTITPLSTSIEHTPVHKFSNFRLDDVTASYSGLGALETRQVRKKLRARSHGYSFFTYGDEYGFGLAPRETASGDFVCGLLGFKTPVILRKHADHFEFIGMSYVDESTRAGYIGKFARIDPSHYIGEEPLEPIMDVVIW